MLIDAISHTLPLKNLTYHWGQKDYLPNFYSRRILFWEIPWFFVYAGEIPGGSIWNCLTKITKIVCELI